MKHKAELCLLKSISNMMSFEPEGCEDGWMSVVGLVVCWGWRPYTVVFRQVFRQYISQCIKLRLIVKKLLLFLIWRVFAPPHENCSMCILRVIHGKSNTDSRKRSFFSLSFSKLSAPQSLINLSSAVKTHTVARTYTYIIPFFYVLSDSLF